jgi:hypothetical protein
MPDPRFPISWQFSLDNKKESYQRSDEVDAVASVVSDVMTLRQCRKTGSG